MEKQGLIEVVARGMWDESYAASGGCGQPNMKYWRERASERLGEIWDEGADAWERAHNMSNYEPWEYLEDNPYKTSND